MLTKQEAKSPNLVLLVLSSIGLVSSGVALAFIIIKQYVGFSLYTNPISCSANSYSALKYNQIRYLDSIDIAQVVSMLAATLALILLIVMRRRFSQVNQQGQQQIKYWSIGMHQILYFSFALAVVALIIPVGYFSSFMIEVNSFCKSGYLLELIIILGTDVGAIACYLVCIYYLIKISQSTDNADKYPKNIEKQLKQIKEQKVEIVKQPLNEKKTQLIQQPKKEQFREVRPIEPMRVSKNQISVENIERAINRKVQIKQPLLANEQQQYERVKKRKREDSEDEYDNRKLRDLRRQRREEEDKIWQLERKKMMLEHSNIQKNQLQSNINPRPKEENTKKQNQQTDKGSGNQTIININVTPHQVKSSNVVPQKQKREEQAVIKKPKSKKYGRNSNQIDEQWSEDSEQEYNRRIKSKYDKTRFQTKRQRENDRQFMPIYPDYPVRYEQRPLQRKATQVGSLKMVENKKKLSLVHFDSIQIAPVLPTSPIMLKKSDEYPQVNKLVVPTANAQSKNQQSFFKKLLEESAVRQRKVLQTPSAPKKRQPLTRKKERNNSPKKKGLDEYIEALNVSLNKSRPEYERNYMSNNSSYQSVLSSYESMKIPAEKSAGEYGGQVNRQKETNSFVRSGNKMQDRIQKKYRNI